MSEAFGLPDWGAPVEDAQGPAWLIRGAPARAFVLPAKLELERDDGRPGYAIETFRLVTGTELDSFGVLTMRFVGDYDIAARQAALSSSQPNVRIEPLMLNEGFVRFISSDAVQLPGLSDPRPLDASGIGARVTMRLSGLGLHAFQQVVTSGIAPVVAQIIFSVSGAAVRHNSKATVDGTRLLSLLEEGAPWSRDKLEDAVRAGTFAAAVQMVAVDDPIEGARAAQAFVDRLTARALTLTPADLPESQPLWKVRSEELANRRLTFDLSDDAVVPRAFLLRSAPLLRPDVVEREVEADSSLIDVPTGFHVVSVDANMPPRLVGAVAIGVELCFPASPPERSQTIVKTLNFGRNERLVALSVQLAPQERLAFDYKAFVIAIAGGGAQHLTGPLQHNDDAHLTVGPAAFPVDFPRAEATKALLQWGSVALAWTGEHADGKWRAEATLTNDAPVVAVCRPKEYQNTSVTAELVATDGSVRLSVAVPPSDNLWLDLSSVPEAGPQRALLRCALRGPTDVVTVECAGEGASGEPVSPTLLKFTGSDAELEFHWLPESPFRAGFHCRWGSDHEWSPGFPGGTTIDFAATDSGTTPWPGWRGSAESGHEQHKDQQVDTTGLALFATGEGSYAFRPVSPAVQIGPDGKPAVQLLAAGPMNFLQLTAEWSVPPGRLASLADALKARDGAPPRLSPAPDNPRETSLWLADASGALKPVASGSVLGAPPQTSLLSASLDEAQAAVLKRALGGEHGLAKLRYVIDAADPVLSEEGVAVDGGDAGASIAVASRASTARFNRHELTSEADLADLITT